MNNCRLYLNRLAVVASFWLGICPFVFAQPGENPSPTLAVTIETDHKDAQYRLNEKAVFNLTIRSLNLSELPSTIRTRLTFDGGDVINDMPTLIKNGKAEVSASLSKPGFLRCDVYADNPDSPILATASAGFSIDQIHSASIEPKDFDQFWSAALTNSRSLSLNIKWLPTPHGNNQSIKTSMASFQLGDGKNIYGYVSMPLVSHPPVPMILRLPSWGAGKPFNTQWAETWAKKGVLALDLSVHDLPLGLERVFYDEAMKSQLLNYELQGSGEKTEYYFYPVILIVDRIIEHFATLPEYSSQRVVVIGSSQGGGLGLILAGLNHRITALAVDVPALGDHLAMNQGRRSGWPEFVTTETPADQRQKMMDFSQYYDTTIFAKRIQIPVIMSVGFRDPVCPPGTIMSTFNALTCPKQLFIGPQSAHGRIPKFDREVDSWIIDLLLTIKNGKSPALAGADGWRFPIGKEKVNKQHLFH